MWVSFCIHVFRKFDKTEQHKRWVKLFTMIDELDILREFISNISGDASAKLSWHKSRIPELEFKIGELLAIIMKRPVHQIEVDEYLPLADEELMKK